MNVSMILSEIGLDLKNTYIDFCGRGLVLVADRFAVTHCKKKNVAAKVESNSLLMELSAPKGL